MKRLIVNADGFGFTFGVNRGIMEAVRRGIVTSVSCNANFPAIEELPQLLEESPHVSVGVHFNLSVGRPVLAPEEVPSLVDAQGELWGKALVGRLMTGRIRRADIERELDAQVRRMHDLGAKPTHWDGHQHRHLYPRFLTAGMRVARKHGIARMRCPRRWLLFEDGSGQWRRMTYYYLRNPVGTVRHTAARVLMRVVRRAGFRTPDRQVTGLHGSRAGNFLPHIWQAVVRYLPAGTSEMVCHPGYPDDTLRRHATYVDQRPRELAILTSPELRDAVAANGVELISYYDL